MLALVGMYISNIFHVSNYWYTVEKANFSEIQLVKSIRSYANSLIATIVLIMICGHNVCNTLSLNTNNNNNPYCPLNSEIFHLILVAYSETVPLSEKAKREKEEKNLGSSI